ncbi:MAG: hypothetical protein WCJ74_01120 [bacterium]
MNIKTLQQISHTQRDIFWATIVAFFVLMTLYISFLSVSIVNVSVRQNTNDKIIALRSKVASLEFQYVAIQNNITTESALSKGYVTSAPVAYVTKESRLSFARP